MDDQELFDRKPGNRPMRMVLSTAERVEHQHAIDHRWKNCADAILPVEVFDHKAHRTIDRPLADAFGNYRLDDAQRGVEAAEEREPPPVLLRRPRRQASPFRRIESSSIPTRLRLRARGLRASNTSSGTMTVRLQ